LVMNKFSSHYKKLLSTEGFDSELHTDISTKRQSAIRGGDRSK